MQAQAVAVPGHVASSAHPVLNNLRRAVPSKAYAQAGALLVHLLQPDVSKRATAKQALGSQFFAEGL